MKTLKFQGYSDDIFIETTSRIEISNCANGKPLQFDVTMPNGEGIRVSGCYDGSQLGSNGCWMIGVESLDEDKPIDWPIRVYPSHEGYCGLMEVDAPDNAVVTEVLKRDYNNP